MGSSRALRSDADDLYHSVENQFERFRGFLELIGRFEFEFRRRTIRIFGVFKVQSHTHHVAVNVHVLWPVCTLTTPFRMLWCP